MNEIDYIQQIRDRITELRVNKGVAEYRMSLELGKSGSYIRNITCGKSLPSVKELFEIIAYFEMSPAEFFGPFVDGNNAYARISETLRNMNSEDNSKVAQFIEWIK